MKRIAAAAIALCLATTMAAAHASAQAKGKAKATAVPMATRTTTGTGAANREGHTSSGITTNTNANTNAFIPPYRSGASRTTTVLHNGVYYHVTYNANGTYTYYTSMSPGFSGNTSVSGTKPLVPPVTNILPVGGTGITSLARTGGADPTSPLFPTALALSLLGVGVVGRRLTARR